MFRARYVSKIEKRRQKLACDPAWSSSLQRLIETPLPDLQRPIAEINLVALDFETTGINGHNDKILSIGTIDMSYSTIHMNTVQENMVNHAQYVQAKSAVINELTPSQLQAGIDIDAAMDQLFDCLRGKVVIAHGAHLEKGFIDSYLKMRYQITSLPCLYIDTMDIEKRFSFKGRKKLHRSYNLTELRQNYGLPTYSEHSAGIDALSCAELFLLQIKRLKLEQYAYCHSMLANL